MINQASIGQTKQLDERREMQLESLIEVNISDFMTSFGLENLKRGRKVLARLSRPPARRFAQQMVDFDDMVGDKGLHTGAYETLKNYVNGPVVEGAENIPESGPVLVLSNHPGMSDTLVLFSSLTRADLRIVAAERPFLKSLYNVSNYLINLTEEPGSRLGVVRTAVKHLRKGGAILTFPAGDIEPDPASMPGALASLDRWSESIAIFARMVPRLQIVTAIVSGVVWPLAMNHPLTRLRRKPKDRERLGATLQVMFQTILFFHRPITARVIYGEPLPAAHLLAGDDPSAIMQAVTGQARKLIERSKTLANSG